MNPLATILKSNSCGILHEKVHDGQNSVLVFASLFGYRNVLVTKERFVSNPVDFMCCSCFYKMNWSYHRVGDLTGLYVVINLHSHLFSVHRFSVT